MFLHGVGGSGDGSTEQLATYLFDTAIPACIAVDGWPNDRPFVVLAPQHNVTDDDVSAYDSV